MAGGMESLFWGGGGLFPEGPKIGKKAISLENVQSRDRKRGHYERGLFTGRISRISKFSKFSRISRKWSDSPFFPTVSGFSKISRISKFSRISFLPLFPHPTISLENI